MQTPNLSCREISKSDRVAQGQPDNGYAPLPRAVLFRKRPASLTVGTYNNLTKWPSVFVPENEILLRGRRLLSRLELRSGAKQYHRIYNLVKYIRDKVQQFAVTVLMVTNIIVIGRHIGALCLI